MVGLAESSGGDDDWGLGDQGAKSPQWSSFATEISQSESQSLH